MATLSISEFAAVGGSGNFPAQAAQLPASQEQVVAIAAGSTPCTLPFLPNTRLVRVQVDLACALAWGVTPVATTSNMHMTAGAVEYFAVPPGANYKVAVIAT